MDKKNKKINISKEIFEIIESKNFKPKPKWYFIVQESGVWILGISATVLGAMAVSTILFVFARIPIKFNNVTHDNVFKFWIDFIPMLWLILFVLFVFTTDYFFRKTKKGYRHSSIVLVISSVMLSITIGYIGFIIGLGEIIERHVGGRIPFHDSFQVTRQRIWSQPAKGLMIGEVIYKDGFMFKSKDGDLIKLNLEEIPNSQKELFFEGSLLSLIGTTTDPDMFLVCMAVPLENNEIFLKEMFFERNKPNTRINICKGVRPYNKLKSKILNYEN